MLICYIFISFSTADLYELLLLHGIFYLYSSKIWDYKYNQKEPLTSYACY